MCPNYSRNEPTAPRPQPTRVTPSAEPAGRQRQRQRPAGSGAEMATPTGAGAAGSRASRGEPRGAAGVRVCPR
eukprot:3727957-Prymnesium_polylepis.1